MSNAHVDRLGAGSVESLGLAMKQRDRAIVVVLVQVLCVNAAVALTKFIVGRRTHSLALMADAMHSALDASSNVVGFLGIWGASRPPDAGHPYGHRRFESLAAGAIGLLIAAGLVRIVSDVVEAYRTGHRARGGIVVVAVVTLTVLVNLAISRFERRRGIHLKSAILIADSRHTMSDALAAIVVLASFAGTALGFVYSDVLAAAVVCLFIGRTAWGVIRDAVGNLADAVQVDPEAVRGVAMAVPGVVAVHRVRSRGQPDFVHLDLHIHLPGTCSLEEAHRKTHEVVDALKAEFPSVHDIVIHTEPANTDSSPDLG